MLLKERGGERLLPIWIGAQEGDLIATRLGEWSQNRPMGPDLTAQLLQAGGIRVERVVIESVREVTCYATVTVTGRGKSHEVDARPSDALNLALRVGAPVLVAQELMDQAGISSSVIASRPIGRRPSTSWSVSCSRGALLQPTRWPRLA